MTASSTKANPMTDAEFQAELARVGYVEAIVAAAKRDGYPVDEPRLRKEATDGLTALHARGLGLDIH